MNKLDFSLGQTSTDSASGALLSYRTWRRSFPKTSFVKYASEHPDIETEILIELGTSDLIHQITCGVPCRAEDYIAAIKGVASNAAFMLDLIDAEICVKSDQGDVINRQALLERFPELAEELDKLLDVHEIDLEASKGTGYRGRGPISIPGFRLARQLNQQVPGEYQPCPFELWECTHEQSGIPSNAVIWEVNDPTSREQAETKIQETLAVREKVSHPNLEKVIKFGFAESQLDDDRYAFVVFNARNGKTLLSLLDHPMTDELKEETIADWLLKINDARTALSRAFGNAPSISPSEVFIDYSNQPILFDFPVLTKAVDKSELQQLGILIFSICLQEGDPSEFEQHLKAGYAPIKLNEVKESVSRKLNAIYLSCVHPNEKNRYASFDDAIDDLKRLKAGENVKASKLQRKWLWF